MKNLLLLAISFCFSSLAFPQILGIGQTISECQVQNVDHTVTINQKAVINDWINQQMRVIDSPVTFDIDMTFNKVSISYINLDYINPGIILGDAIMEFVKKAHSGMNIPSENPITLDFQVPG